MAKTVLITGASNGFGKDAASDDNLKNTIRTLLGARIWTALMSMCVRSILKSASAQASKSSFAIEEEK